MESQCDICVFLFVLKVIRQLNFTARKIIKLTLRTVATIFRSLISLVEHIVSNIVVSGQIGHRILVHKLLD